MAEGSVSLFSGLAVKDVLEDAVLPGFADAQGYAVDTTFEPTTVLTGLIADGARPDVMLGVAGALQQLAAEGVLDPAGLTPLVRSGIGVAVPPGGTPPSIDSVEDLLAAVRGSRSVAYSRTGASGAHFARLLERLGIADEVNARATIVEKGFTGEALLDGRADLAVQQVIELASVDGVQIVGPLPADAQHYVELWLGHATGPSPAARHLFDLLTSQPAQRAYEMAGLEVTVTGKPDSAPA